MVHDLMFAIDGIDARLSEPVSLRDTGPPTSDSYTEWITQHPQLLGPNVRVVATDLRWHSETSADEIAIDVLGIGDDGRLVVGVVLVDDDPQRVLLRALTQAAYASRLEPDTLADMHAGHLRARGQHRTDETALERLVSHAGAPLQTELLARPRMVVFCEHVSAALGTTIVWLDEMGLDIALQRLRAYQVDRHTLLFVSQIFPSEPVTELEVVRPRRLQAVPRSDDAGLGSAIEYDQALPGEPAYPMTSGDASETDVVFTNGFGHGRPPEVP